MQKIRKKRWNYLHLCKIFRNFAQRILVSSRIMKFIIHELSELNELSGL